MTLTITDKTEIRTNLGILLTLIVGVGSCGILVTIWPL